MARTREPGAAAQEKDKNETPMLYSCLLCGESMEGSKQSHHEHLKSTSLTTTGLNESEQDENEEEDYGDLDPSRCFMCDAKHDSIKSCILHLHKRHGLFIPDVEYLKDPKGLLTCLGLKVMREYRCLYCNDRCHPFGSLEAVRKHMAAKSHCKVHYGDHNDEEEEVELEDFYDYSSSYVDEEGNKQLVASVESANNVELGIGGSELVITKKDGISTKTLGSREFLRYYRQKPRPSPANNTAAVAAAASASRQRSMCLGSVKSKEEMMKARVMREMNRAKVEIMRSKIAMNTKSNNMIRNLPKNLQRQTMNMRESRDRTKRCC